MKKKLSVTEYSKIRGTSRQVILRAIKNNWNLEGILKVEKIGATYVLTFDQDKFDKEKRERN